MNRSCSHLPAPGPPFWKQPKAAVSGYHDLLKVRRWCYLLLPGVRGPLEHVCPGALQTVAGNTSQIPRVAQGWWSGWAASWSPSPPHCSKGRNERYAFLDKRRLMGTIRGSIRLISLHWPPNQPSVPRGPGVHPGGFWGH